MRNNRDKSYFLLAARPLTPMSHNMQSRILIVDDRPDNIQILSEILAPYYEVFFAINGKQAMELVVQQDIDLVLLDVVMPDMDGFEVCRRLKADPVTREIPVIFITAMIEVEDEAKGFELGAVDYVVKPVSPPTVLARVKTHLELKSQRDYLRRLCALDGLTGIPNRRCFDEALENEWMRVKRNAKPMSVMLVDIDYFKRFNDKYGHTAGDQCLRMVAESLAEAAQRPGDLMARFGGEEFGCILPECDAAGVRDIARLCLEKVGELRIQNRGSDVAPYITVSIGVVTGVATADLSPAALLEKADKLLYRAKDEGRNRFVHESIEHSK